jgi:hypothetical protein
MMASAGWHVTRENEAGAEHLEKYVEESFGMNANTNTVCDRPEY